MTQAAAFLQDMLDLQSRKKEASNVERIKGNEFYVAGKLQ